MSGVAALQSAVCGEGEEGEECGSFFVSETSKGEGEGGAFSVVVEGFDHGIVNAVGEGSFSDIALVEFFVLGKAS